MPEQTTQTPPTSTAAPSTPSPGAAPSVASTAAAPASTPSRPKGIEGLMADALKAPAPATPSPTDKPDPGKPVDAPQRPAAGAPAPGQTKGKPAPSDTRQNFAKLEQQLTEARKSDSEKAAKITEYEKRIADIEGKFRQTEADARRVQEMEKRITQLQSELSQTAYERSDDFKVKYVEPFNKQWGHTISLVKQLSITEGDELNPTKRQATDADFQKVFYAPVAEQSDVAQKLFGANANLVLTKVYQLDSMRDQANAAVEAHKTDYEKQQAERATTTQKQKQEYQTYHESAANELSEKYPQFFAPIESDPEVSQALQSGYEFVDNSKTGAHADGTPFTTEERAAYAAVIRARAAAFPRLVLESGRKDQKIAALEEELTKYRGSSPGAGAASPAGGKKEGERKGKGIAGLADEF